MKRSRILISALRAALLLGTAMPATSPAAELIVETAASDPAHYTSIQTAIDAAYSFMTTSATSTISYSVRIEPGTYTENLTLKPGVTVRGRETARTILNGGGGTIIRADNLSGQLSIQNLTFLNAAVGINVANNSSVTIANNVFALGSGATAVQVSGAPGTTVTNNVFHQNGTGITSNADIVIVNNVFLANGTAVSNVLPLAGFTKLAFNTYFANSLDGHTGDTAHNVTTDPRFVDIANRDYHLLSGSLCIGSGSTTYPNAGASTSDQGAYGGPGADTIPLPISGLTSSTPSSSSVSLSWSANNGYQVKGYRVYYGTASRTYDGTGATEGASPLNVAAGATSFTLSGLTSTISLPSTPVLDQPRPLNQSLTLSWSAAAGATAYRVYYGTSSPPTNVVDVGAATTHTLTGLTNGQTYYIAVSALNQASYYIAVTAYDAVGEQGGSTVIPGVEHESAYSAEVTASFGSALESPLSNIVSDFPEAITPYPALPNSGGGCFIATAAYGKFSAPEVQALRDFRDRFLLSTAPGRSLVSWYYREGPQAAAWLNAHPAWKPVVRTALMPLVGVSLLLTMMPALVPAIPLLAAVLVFIAYRVRTRRSAQRRGGGP